MKNNVCCCGKGLGEINMLQVVTRSEALTDVRVKMIEGTLVVSFGLEAI
jgi:hypothetical protein